jgi:signal transduction histidine kinase
MHEEKGTRPCGEWPNVERRDLGWAPDWQSSVESDKAALAQSLHDNTGGLLVAAVMDITWATTRLSDEAQDIRERLTRARSALDMAIDMNRRMIEDLRPTLLDNFGLIAALRWHLADVCKSADIVCEQRLPEAGPAFSPLASIALFRIAQTIIALMVDHGPQLLMMELRVDGEYVVLRIRCEGAAARITREHQKTASALASATGRAKSLGGSVQFITAADGAEMTCYLPAVGSLSSVSAAGAGS